MIHHIDNFPGREIFVNGKKYLYFGGTSYLGLQTDPEFQRIFVNNVQKYGTDYGASRKSNVRLSVFEKAEDYLANFVGSEKCITMSSGYLAAQLLVQSLSTTEYKLFYAPHTHTALHLPKTRPYTTFTSLNIALREHLRTKNKTIPVVLLDSIDFSGCNYPDFKELRELPLDQLVLVVDDSHGIGVVGSKGKGVFKKLQTLGAKELIVCCSLGKAFGVQGGAIFGRQERIKMLMETDFFGSASPASPAGMATLLDSETLFLKRWEKLRGNTTLFTNNLKQLESFLFMKDYPVFSFADQNLSDYLEKNAIITTNFSYPSDGDTTKSRIVLGAQHNEQDILRLSMLIGTYNF